MIHCIKTCDIYRDFASDVNLSIDFWFDPLIFEDLFILAAGIGSAAFTIIPYIANLVVAARIKEIIKDNLAAKSWFQHKANLFTLLVVFTGGSYSALALVSSNIFGLKIFGCGITRYELRQLGKMKVIYTVIIENIPQLICQLVYSYALGEITSAVALAFIASALSITASTLSYMIERDTSDSKVVQYYLSTQCTLRTAKPRYEDKDEMEMEMKTFTTNGVPLENAESNSQQIDTYNMLTELEKKNLIENAGRTLKLSENIAEVFGVDAERIEVGQSMINKYGIMTHIVHCVYLSDLEAMEEQIVKETNNDSVHISPRFYISEFYKSVTISTDITKVFRSHFKLNGDFEVVFQHRVGVNKKNDYIRKDKHHDKKRNHILNRVVSQVGMKLNDEEAIVDKDYFHRVANNYFQNEDIVEEHEQLNYVINMVRKDLKRINDPYVEDPSLISDDDEGDSVGLDGSD